MKQLLSILILSILSSCVQLPETGRSAFFLTSKSQENQLGEDGYKEVLKKEKINTDPRLNAILQRVGAGISQAANQPGFRWEFKIIESKQQNAWCMPGGKVAFYTGIFPFLKNEAGMAAVMGHEVAHAVMRHSGQRMSQGMLVQMGLSVADLSFSNSKNRNQLMALLGAGASVGLVLPFSRSHESEADLVGLKYMARAGYDPQEAVRFWQRFGATGKGAPPEFLSTHPAGDTRVRTLQGAMAEALAIYNAHPNKKGIGESF